MTLPERISSRVVATTDLRVHCLCAGEGGSNEAVVLRLVADALGDPQDQPMLLLHGGGQTRHSWHTTLRSVGAHGWFGISIDMRGHGDSDWAADGDYSLDALAGDIVRIAEQLGSKPVLIGASMGGTSSLAALGITRDDPVAHALVLVDIAPNVEMRGASRIRNFMREHITTGFASLDEVADAIQAYNPHGPRPADLSGLPKNVRQRDDGRWYWHWDPRFFDGAGGDQDDETRISVRRLAGLEAAARSLTVPTLLVRGRQSDLLTEDGARKFLEMVPHAQYADVGGAGHMVAGDKNDAFNSAVLTFLDEVHDDAGLDRRS